MHPPVPPQRRPGRIATTIVVSLLLHASLFLFFRSHLQTPQEIGTESRAPLVVELSRQPLGPKTAPPPAAKPAPSAPPAAPAPRQPPRVAKKRSVPSRPAQPAPPTSPQVAEQRRPGALERPSSPAQSAPESTAMPSDMSEMVAAARARRRAAGMAEPGEPTGAGNSKPQGDEVARANIAFSMAQARGRKGYGGLFQVTRMGARSAEFVFRGWDTDSRAAARELVEVEAGPDGNVEDAIVRKMIEIIRKRQSGDFNWDSRRLGRVVVLSARREDNAGLEDFLRKEFFFDR